MSDRPPTDEWLMGRVTRGTANALEPLVQRYAVRLVTFLTRLVGDSHHAEELFQEVFLLVWQKRKLYEFPRPFKAWLYTIALNKCRASARTKQLPTVSLQAEQHEVEQSTLPNSLEVGEMAQLVARALARLPDQQRAVVSLRIWEELSYAEIAEILARSEATVRSHMHHGLARLRELLGPHFGASPQPTHDPTRRK